MHARQCRVLWKTKGRHVASVLGVLRRQQPAAPCRRVQTVVSRMQSPAPTPLLPRQLVTQHALRCQLPATPAIPLRVRLSLVNAVPSTAVRRLRTMHECSLCMLWKMKGQRSTRHHKVMPLAPLAALRNLQSLQKHPHELYLAARQHPLRRSRPPNPSPPALRPPFLRTIPAGILSAHRRAQTLHACRRCLLLKAKGRYSACTLSQDNRASHSHLQTVQLKSVVPALRPAQLLAPAHACPPHSVVGGPKVMRGFRNQRPWRPRRVRRLGRRPTVTWRLWQ